jgi:predicted nucleic acid-binding protein
MFYLDADVLVSTLVPEWHTTFFANLLQGKQFISSELLLGEVSLALTCQLAEGKVTEQDRTQAWNSVLANEQAGELALFPIDRTILLEADQLMLRERTAMQASNALRTADAIHLATLIRHGGTMLFSNDGRLRDAAQHLGIGLCAMP